MQTTDPSRLSAVLTGDLVASRKAAPATNDRAMQVLETAAQEFGSASDTDLRFTRFRGDGWQVLVRDPQLVLDAVLYFHASLRAAKPDIDTRISAGIGTMGFPGTRDLSDAAGTAFFASGDNLDNTKKRRFIIGGQGIGIWQNATFLLVEQIAMGWTTAQAQAVALMLIGDFTQEDIATRIGVTRQAIQLRLASAGFSALHEARHAFRTYDFGQDSGAHHD